MFASLRPGREPDEAVDKQQDERRQGLKEAVVDPRADPNAKHHQHGQAAGREPHRREPDQAHQQANPTKHFFALHTAFQTQYEELFLAVDTIAERIRALEAYVKGLIAANQKVVADAALARDLAGAANDAESQDLMIERIMLHQKTIWMLKSFLKP